MKHQGVVVAASVLFGGTMAKLGAMQARWARANVINQEFRELLSAHEDATGDVVIALVPEGDGRAALERLDMAMGLTAEQVGWLRDVMEPLTDDQITACGSHAAILVARIRVLAGC